MRRKSLRTFVQVLLLGLLLGASSSAYADAISVTSVTVSNVQLTPTAGTIMFFTTQLSPGTRAGAVVTDGFNDVSNRSESPTRSEASITVGSASASALSDFTNRTFSANSSVMFSGCICSAEAEGQTFLREAFTITGGTGNVDVNLSALLSTMQTLMTDQFSLFAASDVLVNLQVIDASNSSIVHNFSFDSRLSIRPPTNATALEIQRQLSEVLALQFNTQYSLVISAFANSRAAQNEIPEPASVVLLVSGLGFMVGRFRKSRKDHARS